MELGRAAVFGATGGTGRLIVRELLRRGVPVRAVSRSAENLARDFGSLAVERVAADLLSAEDAVRAAEGCGVVFHCTGVPLARFGDHLVLARSTIEALRRSGARGVLVSGYWSHSPLPERAVNEKHARGGADPKSRIRKEQEDLMLAAGAAVVTLPDFYGPESTASFLNDGIAAAVGGEKATWPGDPDAPREFVYLPDVAWPIVELATREKAYGEDWVVAGSGWIAPRRALQIAADLARAQLRLREIRPWQVGLGKLFDARLRDLADVYPMYRQSLFFDASKLKELIGPFLCTRYEQGIPATIAWLAGRAS